MRNKSGITISSYGYILIHKKNHPMAGKDNYIPLHRLVYSEYLGRNLTRDEVIHHKNGIKTDNRIENLQLVSNSQHRTIHNMTLEYSHKANLVTMKELYLEGYSGRQIASVLNIGKSTVLYYTKKWEISRSNMSLRDKQGKFVNRKEAC